MAKYGESQYGVLQFGEETIPDSDIELRAPDLMLLLPWFYKGNITMQELQNSASKELGRLYYHLEDFINQLFVDTATWGLSIYETELDLATNPSLPYEERRELIKAKLWGRGTTTKQMIKDTAEAFSGGEVDVIEYPSEYRFVVKFIGVKGIPRNMQGFIDMLEAIKPAHLAYEVKYTYTVWDFIKHLTWNDVSSMTWGDLRVYEGE